jgi:hypothetical protein
MFQLSPIAALMLGLLVTTGTEATDPSPKAAPAHPEFPQQIGPYFRGEIHTFADNDHSVGYDRYDWQTENAVTFYYYPATDSAESQYASEVAGILEVHAGAKLVSERTITIEKDGLPHQAFIASFNYDGTFSKTSQPLSSQLVFISLPDHAFKVRSTSPASQSALAEASMLRLVSEISWTFLP